MKAPNNGGYLLQNWIVKGNDKNGNGKTSSFINSTKSHSPTVIHELLKYHRSAIALCI